MIKDNRKEYTSFEEWKKDAKAKKLSVRQISKSKKNIYYQAISKTDGIVGFFNTGLGGGLL